MSDEKVLVASLPVAQALQLFREQSGSGRASVSNAHGGQRSQAGRGRGRGKGRGQRVKHGRVSKPPRNEPRRPQPVKTAPNQQKQPSAAYSTPENPTPLWNGYQLMGDSMLTRMLESISDTRATYDQNLKCKRLGYLMGGQTVCQLAKHLKDGLGGPIHSKVLIMIGTNDVTKNVPLQQSADGLEDIKKFLNEKSTETVVCLIPPVPKKRLSSPVINRIIKGTFGENSSVIDTNSLFIKNEKINTDLFNMKHPSGTFDAVHLNKKGLQMLSTLIEKELLQVVESELMTCDP